MKNNVDVYIYFTSKKMQQVTSGVVQQLKQIAGVSNVSRVNTARNMVAVEYNPEKITAVKLLNTVKGNGFSAALVGL